MLMAPEQQQDEASPIWRLWQMVVVSDSSATSPADIAAQRPRAAFELLIRAAASAVKPM
jgi:hypothetical protein